MNPSIQQRRKEIEAIQLSEEEISYALWSAKVGKWNQIRNEDYWKELEEQKPKEYVNQSSKVQEDKSVSKSVHH